jgi:MATE family multidrug resistance protein
VIFIDKILLTLGQDPEVVANAAIYAWCCVPGIMFYSWGACYSKYLTAQRITYVGTLSTITASLVHFVVAYVLAVYYELDMLGIGISTSIHFFIRFLVSYGYVNWSGKFNQHKVPLSDPDCRRNIKPQLYLSLQCASLAVWSWWAMDIFTLIASYMSITELAAQTVLRNIILLTFMIPVAIAMGAVILVGNMIGAKNVYGAKYYAKMCIMMAGIWALGSVIFINSLQGIVVWAFGTGPEVNEVIISAFPVLSVYVMFDCL